MAKPIPEAVVRQSLQAVLNLSEAARCLGVAQAKNDQGAIDYWTDKTNKYEAALTAAQQQGGGEVCAEDLRWCEDIAESLREAGGPTNNMQLIALNRLLRHARTTPPSAPVGVGGLAGLLEKIRDLLASLPVDCLGTDTAADGQPYPIRDEVIHSITKALAQQPAPRAPAVVEGFDEWYASVDARFWNNWDACNAAFHAGKRAALAQQPAAVAVDAGLAESLRHAANRWKREAEHHASGFADEYSSGQRHAYKSCALETLAILDQPLATQHQEPTT